ncbi:MAG: hypothetical protein Tsb0014_23540 [Pleurocapsa sp.]
MLLVFLIPVILVLCSICFSFDPKLISIQKVSYFLMLPIVEVIVSAIAIASAKSIGVNILDVWQLYLMYFLFSLAIAATLIVVLIEELNRTIKLSLRLITLIFFGFVLTQTFFSIK